uniref:Ankyrin repeat and sterile alpha motif domain containing 1B n=1 Tax=Takifugu rubripes TaxID=31033 RepID=A0A674MGT9_TAKRU
MGKEQELLEAARTGNVALVEKLLSGKKKILGSGSGSIPLPNLLSMWKGLNVNCTDSSGYTPLHHASLNGHRDVVLKLLQFEASTNVADNKGCFPLHLAAWRGDADIVRILVHHGPSHCRVNQQARLPRRRFADTNDPSETALHCAAQYGHSDVVSVLLHELTDPTMRNSRQETPLDLAALYGRLEVVCMLINTHPNLMTCHCRRHTPLHLAARNGHHSTVQTLLEAGMDVNCVTDNGSALHEAALFGKMDVVRLLLDSGIKTNLRNSQGRTALEILREHPAPKSQQITSLIQGDTHTHTHTLSLSLTHTVPRWYEHVRPDEFMHTFTTSAGRISFSCIFLVSRHLFRVDFIFFYLFSDHLSWKRPPLEIKPKPFVRNLNPDQLLLFSPPDDGPYQREPPPPPHCSSSTSTSVLEDRRKSHIPEEFAGLLHGSSPACETLETPFHLYSPKSRNHASSDPQSAGGWSILGRPPSSYSGQNGEVPELPGVQPGGVAKGSQTGAGYEERACTLGRMRSMPRSVLDLQLSKSLSKSDSNLVAVSMAGSFDSHFARHNMMWQCQLSQPDCRCYRVDGYSLLKRLPLHPLIGPRCPMQSVGQWLDSIGLVQYENHLLANGFDNVQFMGSNVVEDQDLLEIGILNSAHRQRLLQAIRLLPRVRPVGYDGNNPTSVAEWLESLELGDYTKSFLINGYTSMELVKKIWEIELINVLKIGLIGHRKRILASLGDRLHEDTPQKPPRAISLRVSLLQQRTQRGSRADLWTCSTSSCRRTHGAGSAAMTTTSRTCRDPSEWCEPITLRPPNEATSSTPVQYWQHHPEKLIFQSCDYEAYYLGSMLVKELRGTESTQDACAKMRKSTEQMKKVPTIVLSVSYKGVKFIDATNKNIIAEHEIRNISCAAQDPEDLSTFAYITKDLKSSHHYCHVFTAFDVNLAYEIILTLGQAFEVAYQLALQARKSGHGSSTLPESFDSKPSKPVPKPRVNIRKSVSPATILLLEGKLHLLLFSIAVKLNF